MMRHIRTFGFVAVALLALTLPASAEDLLKLAIAQRGAWNSAVPELGQLAGIFKKHGIVLELAYAEGDDDIEQQVVSGSADVGVGVGIMGVLSAFASKGAPVRIIGANMTGSANYWYVLATSPIKTVKDIGGRTIAYSKNGASSQYDVFDFMDRYRVKARPVLTSGAPAAFDQVMSGKIDVGWAAPPFGVDAVEQGQIRVVARANDIPKIREKTGRVMIANADTLQTRKDVLTRFVQGYRESLEWMYSDLAAPKTYAQFAGLSDPVAQRLRDDFFTKEMLSPDNIMGLNAIAKEAATLKYIWVPLSNKQLAELVQVPAPQRSKASAKSVGGWLRVFSPRSP
jgi:NitT/TauT family transport system substrate-binding protein